MSLKGLMLVIETYGINLLIWANARGLWKFAILLEFNFMGNWIVAEYFLVCGGVHSWVRITHETHKKNI